MSAPAGLSTRLVMREVSDMLIARGIRWNAATGCDTLTGLVLEVVVASSVAHLPLRDRQTGNGIGLWEALAQARPVSATAIARSMRLPLTTVRRRMALLERDGLLHRRTTGHLADSSLAGARLTAPYEGDRADLDRVVATLSTAGYAPAISARDAGVDRLAAGVVARQVIAFALRALETLTDLHGDLTDGVIVGEIIASNIRHVTNDRVLALAYADEDTPPPDAMRVPVSLRSLASGLGLPFETVRRRVAVLIAQGAVDVQPGGVVVPTRRLMRPEHIESNRRTTIHFAQMLGALVALASPRRPAAVRDHPAVTL